MMTSLKKPIVDFINIYRVGKRIYKDEYFNETAELSNQENLKRPRRTDIINHLILFTKGKTYLEIGVRNPKKNFDKIKCENKFSVDPGIEYEENPVDFKMTSDDFFKSLRAGELNLKNDIKFDVIFIDGLHISDQVERDILNCLDFIAEDGFIILHDCNPPSEFHQREQYAFQNSPARTFWNGTTWKAFYKYRHRPDLFSICFDCDWGVGVISKASKHGFNTINTEIENEFYEYAVLDKNRKDHLNLYSFNKWVEETKE